MQDTTMQGNRILTLHMDLTLILFPDERNKKSSSHVGCKEEVLEAGLEPAQPKMAKGF